MPEEPSVPTLLLMDVSTLCQRIRNDVITTGARTDFPADLLVDSWICREYPMACSSTTQDLKAQTLPSSQARLSIVPNVKEFITLI